MMANKHNLILSFGDIPILLRSNEPRIIAMSRRAMKEFIVKEAKPVIKINIIFDEQFKDTNPYIYGNPHRTSILRESNKIFIRGGIYRGIFDIKALKGEIREGLALAPIYLFLRFVASVYLPMVDGFIIHSSSIAIDGKGYLFSGPPHSGKSTIVKLSRHHQVLSDDFSIIRKIDGYFCCFGSPFWGHVEARGKNIRGKKDYVPIKGLYFLKQDDESYVRKLNKLEATLRLIRNISILAKNKEIHSKIIGLADEFTDKIPINILHFKLDNSFWRCIENG